MHAQPCSTELASARNKRRHTWITRGDDPSLVQRACAHHGDFVSVEQQALNLSTHRGTGAVFETEIAQHHDAQRTARTQALRHLLEQCRRRVQYHDCVQREAPQS